MSKNINRNNVQLVNSWRKKRQMTVSLTLVTFLFLVFTLPNMIFFNFLFTDGKNDIVKNFGGFTNHLVFLQHSTLFFSLFFTNIYFRRATLSLFNRKSNNLNQNSDYINAL
jgi:hypothetical protein